MSNSLFNDFPVSNNVKIFLVDNSGSTMAVYLNGVSILQTYLKIIKNNIGVNSAFHMLFWNSLKIENFYENINVHDAIDVFFNATSNGDTDLSTAFH